MYGRVNQIYGLEGWIVKQTRKNLDIFQTVTFEDLSKLEKSSMPSGVGILGYAVDKGVALNKGRIGAKEGPDAIKQAFAGLRI